MSENPYKAQFQANKANTGFNKPSTVPSFMAKNQTTKQGGQQPSTGFKPPGGAPQWKPNQNSTTTTPFQPPGFKPPVANQSNPSTTPPSVPFQPPGFKPPGSAPVTGPTNTGFQPPGFKPPGTNLPNQQPGGFGNWKNKASPIGTERQKEQEQARIKKQKQQEQKKRKLKQEQIAREEREMKRMQYQDQYSQIRQQEDKRKKPTKTSKKILKSPEKKSPTKSYKKLPSISTSFHRYLFNLNLSCSKQQQYSQKVENQKQFLNLIYKFTEELKQGLISYLKQRKISQRKKNIINLQNMVIEYALVEGISGQPGSAYFKTKSIQNLQLKYCYYQVMFILIAKLIKKSTVFRIRVPLLARFSYKGMEFLGQGVCQQLIQAVPAPAQNFIELHGQLTQLQKQLKQAGYQFLTRKLFLLKKITFNNQQIYILYIPQPFQLSHSPKKSQQNSRLQFHPYITSTFDSLTNLSLINSHKISLTYTLMRNFNEQLKRNTTQKMNQAYLNLFQLAHAIRIVYASCQGELQDQYFWNLIWDGNLEIWEMVKRAYEGFYGQLKSSIQQNMKNKFMLAKIIEVMVPVTFGVGKQRLNEQIPYRDAQNQRNQHRKRPKFLKNTFLIYPYPLQTFQIYQISNFFDKTVQNPAKIKIAQDSHTLQQCLLQKSQQLYINSITVLTNKSLLLFKKGLFTNNPQLIKQSIQNIQNYQIAKGKQMQKIIIYPLLLKLYMEAIEANLQANIVQNKQQTKQQQQKQQKVKQSQDKFKLDQSQVRLITNFQQIKLDLQKEKGKTKQQSKKKKLNKLFRNQQGYQARILKIFQLLLAYIEQLFQNQKQIWMHAGLYLILASYYSKPILKTKQSQKSVNQYSAKTEQFRQFSYFNNPTQTKSRTLSRSQNNLSSTPSQLRENFKNAQSFVQQLERQEYQQNTTYQHPYRKQCMKFIQLGHNIFMQYYGAHSTHMAQFLLHQSDIYYNIHEYKKSEASIIQALKIYKSSSKHSRQILTCSIILGKSLLQMGKQQKNNKIIQKAIQILQKTVEDLANLSMDAQAMSVYEFLCMEIEVGNRKSGIKGAKFEAIVQNDGNISYAKIQQYLQKMSEMAFLSKNIQSLKKVIKRVIKNQLAFYSKQRSIALKETYDRYIKQNNLAQEDQHQQLIRLQQNMTYLEQQKTNFGGVIEVIKWSFGTLRSKNQSIQFEKANQNMKNLLGFFNEKQLLQLLCL